MWTMNLQLLHPSFKRGGLQSENFSCPTLAANAPSSCLQDLENVDGVDLFQSMSRLSRRFVQLRQFRLENRSRFQDEVAFNDVA